MWRMSEQRGVDVGNEHAEWSACVSGVYVDNI